MITIIITEKEAGSRLDRVVRKQLPLMPLSSIYGLIRRGGIRISPKRKARQDYRLVLGDQIEIDVDPAELAVPQKPTADVQLVNTGFFKRNFSILFEDADLLVCNKPAGLVVHPGSGHLNRDTLVDLAGSYLFAGKKIREPDDFALVHRLDRETSGVILIAKNKPALRRIHELFRERSLTKQYIAICHNRPPKNEGEIRLFLHRGRDDRGETTMMVGTGPGREGGGMSSSRYRVDAFNGSLSRVEVLLETGKTHQIRVHLAHNGAPIVGDGRYGDAALDSAFFSANPRVAGRLYLHAWKIALVHPRTGREFTATAPIPKEFAAAMLANPPQSAAPEGRKR